MKNLYRSIILCAISFFFFLLSSAQIVINEISPDAGNNDGSPANQTAEFIELYNAGASAVNISCWVISDGQSWIRIPNSTSLAAGAYYLIASSGYPSMTGIGTGATGINCPTCDFARLPITLDWGPAGIAGVRTGNNILGSSCTPPNPATGNSGNRDEAWVLFNNSGVVIDAVYFGKENNACGILYPINSPALTGLSGCPDEPAGKFVIPTVVFSGTDNNGYKYAGPQLNGCNSSYQRIPDGGGWANGDINNASYPFGVQPSSQPTNHPTPGKNNNSAPFTFTGSGTGGAAAYAGQPAFTICSNGTITYTYIVNNYQNVQPTKTYDISKIGSYVAATGTGAFSPSNWATVAPNTPTAGQTTLTYTVTPPIGTTTYELVWEDFIVNCCGGSSPTVASNSSSPSWECYERKAVTITRIAPMVASKTTVTCPADFTAGTLDISTLISGGGVKSYQLKDNGVNIGTANTNGVFLIPTTLTGPITVDVTDITGCSLPITISINNICRAAPICPIPVLNTVTTTPSGAKCPADIISLCIDNVTSSNLPVGGIIEWYRGINNTFNPYLSPSTDKVCTAPIITTANSCPQISGVFINAFNIALAGEGRNELVMFNSGSQVQKALNIAIRFFTPPATCGGAGTNVYTSASFVSNATTNAYVAGMNSSCPGKFIEITSTNFDIPPNSNVIVLSSTTPNDTYNWCTLSGTQYYILFTSGISNGAGNFSNTASRTFCISSTSCSGCNKAITYAAPVNTDGYYVLLNASGTETNGIGATGNASLQAIGNNSIVPLNEPTCSITSVACCSYTITNADCNNSGNLFFKAIVKPLDGSCSQTNATSIAAGGYSVTCPTSILSGGGSICNGIGTPSSVNLIITSSSTFNGYTLNYLENGVAKSVVLSGVSPYSIAVTNVGTYEAVSVTPPGSSCAGTITGSAEVTRKVPALATTVEACIAGVPGMLLFPVEAAAETPVTFTAVNANAPTTNNSGSFTFPPALAATTQTFTMTVNGCSASLPAIIVCDAGAPVSLPLRLLYFTGKLNTTGILLSWGTATEERNSSFEVERSADGFQFTVIGKIEGTALSNGAGNYVFTDAQPLPGLNYYRLKITEQTNRIVYSKVIQIRKSPAENIVSRIDPNPFTHSLSITVTVAHPGKLIIKLLTENGVLIKSTETTAFRGSNKLVIDQLNALPAGVYIVEIKQGNESQKNRVIKQ